MSSIVDIIDKETIQIPIISNSIPIVPIVNHYSASEELSTKLKSFEEDTYVHFFGCGIESESAGRALNKSAVILRNDLLIIPYTIADKNDIVLAPPPRIEFLEHLRDKLGIIDLPTFIEDIEIITKSGIDIKAIRPFGIAGDHMRRSNIAKYRDDVAVCKSLEEINNAVELYGPKIVIKSEYSSGGQGIRWRWDDATEGWAINRLRQDGCVTVEPYFDIITELSGEFLYGLWNGISIVCVEHGMWRGQWLGNEHDMMSDEVYDFVYSQKAVQKKLESLKVPESCGFQNCGMDIAITRNISGALEVRLLECNARTNMVSINCGVSDCI